MRVLTNFAALVAVGTIGFAVGDFASHPNALGAVGLILLIAAFMFLLSFLHRPGPELCRYLALGPGAVGGTTAGT